MKDYSKIYPSQEEMLLKSGQIIFDIQRNNGGEKQLVIIDNYDGNLITVKSVIQTHTNPLNEDKEDRQLLVPSGTIIHTGSTVEFLNEKWMVISNVGLDDDNGTYIKCKIYPINNKLKFKDSKNMVQSIPCIMSNMSLYSIGIKEEKEIIIPDNKRYIIVPYSDILSELYLGQRFIFKNNVFSITEIYDGKVINNVGYLEIKMQNEQRVLEDDFNAGIASQTIASPNIQTGSDDW